ncbi:MAG: hypothetical protein IKV23_04215 [Bacteroidaceae bacterium]|nr:hypothetical protein [Bacteroidaceae bacterium]
METGNYRAQLDNVRKKIAGLEHLYTDEGLKYLNNAMFLCIGIAEENLEKQDNIWENAGLAREFLEYSGHLLQFEHTVNAVPHAANKMAECIIDHPRLRLKIMRVGLEALHYIEMNTMHELSITEDLRDVIRIYEKNIAAADSGKFDGIVQEGHLKSDPIEWTAQWEEVIDKADEIVYKRLGDYPRGMGFCHALWHERTTVLREQFGIEWRSPSAMNPHVIFD